MRGCLFVEVLCVAVVAVLALEDSCTDGGYHCSADNRRIVFCDAQKEQPVSVYDCSLVKDGYPNCHHNRCGSVTKDLCYGFGVIPDPTDCRSAHVCHEEGAPPIASLTCSEGFYHDGTCIPKCPWSTHQVVKCEVSGETFPDAEDCHQFILCTETLEPVHIKCPSTFFFDSNIKQCVDTNECPTNVSDDPSSTSGDTETAENSTDSSTDTSTADSSTDSSTDTSTTDGSTDTSTTDSSTDSSTDTSTTDGSTDTSTTDSSTDSSTDTSTTDSSPSDSTSTTEITTQQTNPPLPSCNKPGLVFPNYDECHAYWYCNNAYQWVLTRCGTGMYFHKKILICVPGTCTDSTTTAQTSASDSTEPSTPGLPACNKPGLIAPDYSDCNFYWYCTNGYQWVHTQCATGFYFHKTILVCVPGTCTNLFTPTCSKVGEIFSYPPDCKSYHYCDRNLVPIQVQCPAKSYFHKNLLHCVPADFCPS